MNILLVYPEFPDTFWSFKHALKLAYTKASSPSLGLITTSALSVNATFYECQSIMCPKQDKIENIALKALPYTKFERILVAASDGIVTLDRDNGTSMLTLLPNANK